MPVILLTILRKYWKLIAIALFVLFVFGYWKHLTGTIDDLEKEKVVITAQRDLWKGNYDSLSAATAMNNTIMNKLSGQADAIEKSLGELSAKVGTSTSALNARLSSIKTQDLSKLTDKEAVDYLRGAAKGMKQ